MPVLSDDLQNALATYFKSWNLSLKQQPQIEALKNCILLINILEKQNIRYESIEDFYFEMAKNKLPDDFQNVLAKIFLQRVFYIEELKINDLNQVIERFGMTRFAQLASASQHMFQKEYREVFIDLLKLDLTGGNVDDFLHNKAQDNQVGRSLADHNQFIRGELELHHISAENALTYPKTSDVIIFPNEETNISLGNMYIVLWSYLAKLEEETKKLLVNLGETNSKDKDKVQSVLSAMTELRKTMGGKVLDSRTVVESLMKLLAHNLIGIIITNIKALEILTSRTFTEFATHVIEQLEHIKKFSFEKNKVATTNKCELHHFRIMQWPKQNLGTFFLGDEVGCCLATNGAQFQAMVQRRMDAAMLFHVAIDKKTGKVAALIWLYLAKTNDGRIVLIANFFEVNVKYAVNEKIRLALLNSLLQFTQEYCEDNPGIAGFYMNELSYGWNERDLDEYPLIPMTLKDKLGGPLIPGVLRDDIDATSEESRELTKQKYYLDSLGKEQFRRFEAMILARNSKPYIVEKDKIIQQAVFRLTQQPISIEDAIFAVSSKHRLELEPFYANPMENDPAFASDIASALQKAIAFRVSHGYTSSSVKLILQGNRSAFFTKAITDQGQSQTLLCPTYNAPPQFRPHNC